jgi:PAS domain S-box-containing protein
MLDGLDAAVYVSDWETDRILYVNRRMREVFGEVRDQPCWQILQPGQKGPCSFCAPRKPAGDDTASNGWQREVRNEQSGRWYELRGRTISWRGGRPARLMLVTDITARKEREVALASESRRLFSLLDQLPAFVYLQAPDHTIRYANSYFQNRFGDPGEKRCYEALWQRDQPCRPCPTFRVFKTKTPQVWEWADSPDGCVYQIYDYPFTDTDSSELVLELGIDITQRKTAEQALASSEARFKHLFEESPITLCVGDFSEVKTHIDELREQGVEDFEAYFNARPDAVAYCASLMTVRELNQAGVRMYKTQDKMQLVSNLRSVCTRDSDRALRAWLVCMAEGRTEFESEVVTRTFTGERLHNNIKLVALPSYAEPYARVLVSNIDITESKKMEETLLRNRNLESLAVLAGGIAHDYNNLLTAILGQVSLAKMSLAPGDELFDRLAMVEEASLQARELTRQLLTFAGRGAPVKRITSFEELITKSARFALSGANVKVAFDIAPDLAPVEVDVEQISQVIHNLVTNAKEGMPQGGTVSIRARNAAVGSGSAIPVPEGHYVHVSVEDEGTPISEENISRIFDPYFSNKHYGPQKGTGLGLAICHALVTKHGGAITAESKAGRGTTIHIYLTVSRKG